MQILLFFIGIIVALMLLDKLVNRNAKRDFLEELDKNWGTCSDKMISDEEFSKIRYYFDHTKGEYDIDDITWHDLDMDRVYSMMNRTNSYIGREYLYAMLRKLNFNVESLKDRDAIMKKLAHDKDARIKLQLALCNIGNKSDISIYEYLTRISKVESKSCLTSKIQNVLLILAGIMVLVTSGVNADLSKIGLLLGVVMIAVNIATYFKHKAQIAPYLSFFSYLIRMLKSVKDICNIEGTELDADRQVLNDCMSKLEKVSKKSVLLAQSSISGSFFEGLMDYVKMIFHVDIIKFYSMLEILKNNEESIRKMYETVGKLDALCSVASFRKTLNYYCEPEFIEYDIKNIEDINADKNSDNKTQNISEDVKGNVQLRYTAEDVYHPLIKNPVCNSIDEEKSVLLTGSNASGKSTFIRTLALNTLLSQTIYTSVSKKYIAPFYQIYSSMALKDNLLGGESYYMVEIKSLKRVCDADTSKYPVLCFIDEVLRGTNTLERISASAHILASIAHHRSMCLAATHDIELTKILENYYKCYHFREEVSGDDISFDYKLYKGPAKSRNAIKLLSIIGYDKSIVNEATNMAGEFLETGKWQKL